VARAAARVADFQVPSSPRTTFNVGRIGGGTSINAIPSEAWMEVDLRSGDPAALRSLEKQLRQAVQEAAAEENARWRSQALEVVIETVGMRPAARIPTTAPIVQPPCPSRRLSTCLFRFQKVPPMRIFR
jgi:metal-dependent amidase/aminoacylase/carboxypeptidase family protein